MNRRNFLKITFAAGLAMAAPVALTRALERQLPVIYGDGVHDDTKGLEAAMAGQEFIARNDCVRVDGGVVYFQPRTFLCVCFPKGLAIIGSGGNKTAFRVSERTEPNRGALPNE